MSTYGIDTEMAYQNGVADAYAMCREETIFEMIGRISEKLEKYPNYDVYTQVMEDIRAIAKDMLENNDYD